jgi:hypothetical protein
VVKNPCSDCYRGGMLLPVLFGADRVENRGDSGNIFRVPAPGPRNSKAFFLDSNHSTATPMFSGRGLAFVASRRVTGIGSVQSTSTTTATSNFE